MSATVIKYSASFKQQVVRDLESGRFRTINEAGSFYGIQGRRPSKAG